jgi:PAS domain S-box-containing protein
MQGFSTTNKRRLFILFGAALVGYFLMGKMGLALAKVNGTTAPIWPATGFAIALMARFGLGLWPAFFAASFLANFMNSHLLGISFAISCGNAAEVLLSAYVLKVLRFGKSTDTQSGVEIQTQILAIILMSLSGPMVSALVGAASFPLFGVHPWSSFYPTWVTWWFGDALGALILFPLFWSLFDWIDGLRENTEKARPLKSLIFIGSNIFIGLASSYFVFETDFGKPYIFIFFPLLLFTVLTAGNLGLKTLTLSIYTFTILEATRGVGPFSWENVTDSLISLQIFLFSIGITSLGLGHLRRYLINKVVISFLMIGWILSGIVFYSLYSARQEIDQNTFADIISDARDALRQRLLIYENVLRASAGLFQASDEVTRHDWNTFINGMGVLSRYQGANSFGYIKSVPRSQLNSFEKEQRRTNPAYRIKGIAFPSGGGEAPPAEAFVVKYVVPEREEALGVDISTEPVRRHSAEVARDTGVPQLTPNIILVTEHAEREGFLFLLPFYHSPEVPKTLQERRKFFRGWIYGSFIFENLLGGFKKGISQQINFALFPQGREDLAHALYQSAPLTRLPGINSHNPAYLFDKFKFGGRDFSILWMRRGDFSSTQNTLLSWLGTLCALLTLISAWLYANGLIFQERAAALVQAKTKELSERELLWRTLMGTTPGGIFQTDESGRIQYANMMLTSMTGKDLAELKNLHWLDMVLPADRPKVQKSWTASARRYQSFQMQFRLKNAAGEISWMEVFLSKIIAENGESLGSMGLIIDVTDRIHMQAERDAEQTRLAQASKMASLGEMAGGIAHEINNPLAIIFGKTAQIKRQLAGNNETLDRTKILNGLVKIESTVDRIARIVRGLRTLSRNADNDPMQRTTVAQVVDDSLSIAQEKFKECDVELLLEIQDASVLCRAAQISQVLLNLLNNSLDALQRLPQKWIRIESRLQNSQVRISVTDSGTGIPEDIRAQMMEPFFTTKEVGKGTGLGLSISKKIIENHGGSFFYEERDGHTCFVIRLPLA